MKIKEHDGFLTIEEENATLMVFKETRSIQLYVNGSVLRSCVSIPVNVLSQDIQEKILDYWRSRDLKDVLKGFTFNIKKHNNVFESLYIYPDFILYKDGTTQGHLPEGIDLEELLQCV